MIEDRVIIGYRSKSHNTTVFRPYWHDSRLQRKLLGAEAVNARLGRSGGLTSAHARGNQGGRGRGSGKRGGTKGRGSDKRGRGSTKCTAMMSPTRPKVNVTQQAKKKGGKKQPQAPVVSPEQDAVIAAVQQEAADLQRAAAEKQRAVAALRAQTGEQVTQFKQL